MRHYKPFRAWLLVSTLTVTVSQLLEDAALLQSAVVTPDGMIMREESHEVVSTQMEPKFQGGDLVLTVRRSGITTSHTLKEYNFVKSGIQSVSDTAQHEKPNFRSFKTDSSTSSIPARAHFFKDGRITGWFGFAEGLLELEFDHQTAKTSSRVLQMRPPRLNTSFLTQTRTELSSHEPYDNVWHAAQTDGHEGGAYNTEAVVGDASLGTRDVPDEANWAGTKWWGDAQTPCFNGDDRLWKMNIGVMVDRAGMAAYPNWQERISAQIAAASIMYEKQMNVELVVAWWLKYTNDGAAPELFKEGCSLWTGNEHQSLQAQLTAVSTILSNKGSGTTLTEAQVKNVVTAHMFTGCDNDAWGTVGLAGVGCLGQGDCSGVNNLRSQWGTFAHELGHNFGGSHSFENGQGTTGGIMDYGDGKFGNSYQFNTDFRQCQICSVLTALRLSKHEGFFPSCDTAAEFDWDQVAKGCECQDDPAGAWGYSCAAVQQNGWCDRYSVMKATCPVSCDLCTPGSNTPRRRRATPAAGTCCANNPAVCDLPVTTFSPGPLSCSDMVTYCSRDGFSATLEQQCPNTCGHCPEPATAPTPPPCGSGTTPTPIIASTTTTSTTTTSTTTMSTTAMLTSTTSTTSTGSATTQPTSLPTTESPATEAPTTQASTTQSQTTQAPATQAPSTAGSDNSIAPCVRHVDGCVSTGGYPDLQYGVNEGCEFTMPSLPLRVEGFNTEAGYDKLSVNGQDYSGTNAPGGVIPEGPLIWSSDHSEQSEGFKICPGTTNDSPAATEPDTTTTTVCSDSPNWLDSDGYDCHTWEYYAYCEDGVQGSGWDSSWGGVNDYPSADGITATQGCCACGRSVSAVCSDLPNWSSQFGYSCGELSDLLYCENGAQGSGWPSSWGSLDNWSKKGGITVSQACCACGGGT